MTSVTVQSKSGQEQLTPESFAAWKRRVGKDTGFVSKTTDDERLVFTGSDMRRLPTGSFEGVLVTRCAIADPVLKKQLRGCDAWKDA